MPAKHLVTGGGGFIGAALVRQLLATGQQVRVIDNYSRGRPERLAELGEELELLAADVCDLGQVREAAEGCGTVWHLAFINGTRFFYERPDDVLEVGIKGTFHVIDAALAAGAKRLVFASTSETYNEPTHVPTRETERLIIPDVTNPRFSYGGGKLTGELLTLHYAGRRGLEGIIVRPHNIYGPDMGFEHVIPEIIAKIYQLSGGKKGGTLDLPIQGDGKETRAFCYIDDAGAGFRIAGENGSPGEIYHLGCQEETTIVALVEMLGKNLGDKSSSRVRPPAQGEYAETLPGHIQAVRTGLSPPGQLGRRIAKNRRWYWNWYGAHGK